MKTTNIAKRRWLLKMRLIVRKAIQTERKKNAVTTVSHPKNKVLCNKW